MYGVDELPITDEVGQEANNYLGDVVNFVNIETGEEKKLRPVYEPAGPRYKGGFALAFNRLFYILAGKNVPSEVLSFLILRMNQDNVCKVAIKEIAGYFDCTERNIRNSLNVLAKIDVIARRKDTIMVNPLCVVRCKADKFKELLDDYQIARDRMPARSKGETDG